MVRQIYVALREEMPSAAIRLAPQKGHSFNAVESIVEQHAGRGCPRHRRARREREGSSVDAESRPAGKRVALSALYSL